MSFLSNIKNQYKTLSIVGMAKNSGKTTALNYLLEEAFDEGFLLGITSTGRDGETSDLVTGTDKPKVYLFTDTIVSVPIKLYELAETGLEILKRTEYRTALGNILICRVAESGYVQIAGPGSISEHKRLCEDMLNFGVDMIFIDGAIDRKSIASPQTSDAIILATGAVISRSLKVIVEETVHIVSLYGTDVVTDEKILAVLEKEDDGKIILIDDDYNKRILSVKTGLGAGLLLDQAIEEHTRFVYIPGAFTESMIAEVNPKKLSTFTFLLPDPTRIFISAIKWQQLKKKGLKVKVLNNIKVAAVTVNPYSPSGYSFDHEELRSSIEEALKDIPVFDVRTGGLEL
ncbi:MAG: hypothetical protein EOM59_08050 [Clostridia bacterium]|nr:hypothetical protein [Clostridia bacterium]